MKIKLVFSDWRDKNHKTIYNTEKGIDLSMGAFHNGTTFDADIELDEDSASELKQALDEGFNPVFYVIEDDDNTS